MEYSVLLLLLLNKSWFPVVYCYTSHPGCRLSQNLPTPRLMSSREVQDREEFTPFLIPANLYHNIGGPGFELPGIVGRFGCPLGYCRCPEIPPPLKFCFGSPEPARPGLQPWSSWRHQVRKNIYFQSCSCILDIFYFKLLASLVETHPNLKNKEKQKGGIVNNNIEITTGSPFYAPPPSPPIPSSARYVYRSVHTSKYKIETISDILKKKFFFEKKIILKKKMMKFPYSTLKLKQNWIFNLT